MVDKVYRVLQYFAPFSQFIKFSAVIFSRLDQEDKLLVGCRKVTNSVEATPPPDAINGGAPVFTENGNSLSVCFMAC